MAAVANPVRIRPARPGDEHGIFALIRSLASYEKLEHEVTGTADALGTHLFSPKPACEALVAHDASNRLVGYALFFSTYSTFLTKPGLYLEDLFVLPEVRRQGIGAKLLTEVAKLAVYRGMGRLEWSVLDWNEPALAFYHKLGASKLDDWTVHRVSGPSLLSLAGFR